MNPQPATYLCHYPSARKSVAAAFVLIAIAVFATLVRAQQSNSLADPAAQQLLRDGKKALAGHWYDEAEKAFKKANKIEHDACLPCWEGLARAQVGKHDVDGALKSTDKAMNAATDDRQRAQVHDLRAEIFVAAAAGAKPDQKKLKVAETEARTAIQLDADQPNYHLRLAIALFREMNDDEAKKETQRYLDLALDGPDNAWAKSVLQDPRRARGNVAPDFEMTTASGDKLTLAGLSGKFIVLDFWATWCGPCRESVGDLKELTRKYSKDRVVLISVSADSNRELWSKFVTDKKMDWEQYWDEGGSMRRLFDVRAFPTYIVIDGDGMVRDRIVGEDPQKSVVYRLKETLQSLTPEKGS